MNSQDKVYTATTCAVSQTLSITTSTPCDNKYFYCQPGTTTYIEYDDPTTGKSYLNKADPTAGEKCGTDAITYCVSCVLSLILLLCCVCMRVFMVQGMVGES